MAIDTTHLDSGTDKIKAAREALLEAVQKLNQLTVPSPYAATLLAAGSAAEARAMLEVAAILTPEQFGAVGGDADDTTPLQDALAAANGRVLDLLGRTWKITAPVSADYTLPTGIVNGSIVFAAVAQSEYAVRIRTTSHFISRGLSVDGSSKAAKVTLINPNAASCIVYIEGYRGAGALQTDTATSVAAALDIKPETDTENFAQCIVVNSTMRDVTSTKADTGPLSTVGRGLNIWGCLESIVKGNVFANIGPHQDGDGLVIAADTADVALCSATISGNTFIDCQKRSIKTQVERVSIGVNQYRRTTAFADNGSGQAEVDMQRGGVLDGGVFTYADGAAPSIIVAIGSFGAATFPHGLGSAKNFKVRCVDANDIIKALVAVQFEDTGANFDTVHFENIECNALVRNVVRCYNKQTSLATRDLRNLILRNIRFAGFSGDAEAAYLFLTRGSASTFNVFAKMYDVVSDANAGAAYYLDPTPGSTAFLVPTLEEVGNVKLTNAYNGRGFLGTSRTYNFLCPENGNLTKTFTLNHNASAVVVTVTYTSARDSSLAKLATIGVVQSAGEKTYYLELVAGQKASTQAGSIAIAADAAANRFTVSHTAGSTASSGWLSITVSDVGYISSIA